nr:MAG TPA: hypothetical protein [Caudoviricetes sp.]
MSMENVSNHIDEAAKLAKEVTEAEVENTETNEQVNTDESVNMKIEKPNGRIKELIVKYRAPVKKIVGGLLVGGITVLAACAVKSYIDKNSEDEQFEDNVIDGEFTENE